MLNVPVSILKKDTNARIIIKNIRELVAINNAKAQLSTIGH